jgi:hypothetical protein
MEPAGTNLGRFPSKFLLMIIPGLIASGVVASVLYAVHVSRAPSSSELLTDLTPQGDGLSAEERRGLTRQMLKARRENPQEPVEVRPTPTSRPADSGPAEAPAVDGKAAAKAAVDRAPPDHAPPPDRTLGAAPLPVARPAPPRARPDASVITMPAAPAATSTAPAVAAASQSAPLPLGTTDPASQPPVTANSSSGVEPEPEPRGFAAKVFSSLSTVAGTAANATGNTVNWVIDLPGKAISAGGRLFGGDSPASNQPAGPPPPAAGAAPSAGTVPPPATAPPPRRNL